MQFLLYIIIYPFIWLISSLPFKLLYAFSDVLYFLVYKVFGYRKKVVKENLNLVFPEKSPEEIKIIMNKFYHHLCDMIVEAMKSLTISEKEMQKRFTFTNIEELRKHEENNRSVVLMCAHYGSWEWIFVLQTHVKAKGYAVYKRLANPYFDKLVKKIRAKFNSYLITTKETATTLALAKANNELTINGFVSDQSPKLNKAHHWQNFMGIKVPVHTGAELLAKRLDMSVVFFGVKRIKRGYYETTFTTIAEKPNSFKDYEITDAFLKLTEEQIYAEPQYYLWTHKRWKHRNSVPLEFQ
ncbi:lysophospholipid acyltransferase family protein [Bizionia paragorgiae]|uniref:KDO2-lipid IV(A) lauroyltransferase n=1 Tax=Bizionia paragorgiae TaxID=283786 RepID=A0A1H3XIY2_BIZPA|nr:lysophospholipid acyltransferase family protein [Bizionia paragorgiae]MDX1272535.1 lysophospholipid acyltransferase family protein [Bizionia paragorgiae]SDZ99405.1 KDO2-lipid IV(A) lauroyltransferase [Bizionia paragorgiae]